jgi:hypothetical protein
MTEPAMPANEPTAQETAATRMDRGMVRWLVEAALILVSVAVGFGAAEFGQYRESRALERAVLAGVRAEVEANLAALEPLLVKHRQWQAALAGATASDTAKTAFDVLFVLRPDAGVTIGMPLKRAAWNTAVSSGALRLLDYDAAEAISEIYGYQELMVENHNRLVGAALYSPATFDPAMRQTAVRVLWGVLSEIAGNEAALRDLYVKHLPLLQSAAAN